MKRLVIILMLASAMFSSCGIVSQTVFTSGKSVPATFFDCPLGSSESMVSRTMYNQNYDINRHRILSYNVLPLGNRKIKSQQTYNQLAYGGYSWQKTTFLFDFRDCFFCIAFLQDFSNMENAKARYNDIKATLDDKYGVGQVIQYGVTYGNPEGNCIILAIIPITGKDGAVCGLYYMDEEIYNKNTAAAVNEL